MGNDTILRKLADSEFDLWRKLVAESPSGSVYSLPEYLSVLCEATGGRFSLLGVFRGDELVGGLPLYEESGPAGPIVSSRLLLYYNGIVLKPLSTRYPSKATSRYLDVLGSIGERLAASGYARIILSHQGQIDARPFLNHGWTARPGYTYVVPISDLEAAWGRVDQNLRRLVNRCSEAGATLSEDDDFDSFFRLHSQTHDRKGAPIYLPADRFGTYFRALKSKGIARLYQARLQNGQSVAAQIVLLGPSGRSYTVCAGADAEHLGTGTTPWLRWEVFKMLSRDGYQTNDLTDATLNEVTRFKSQLGGDLVTNIVIQRADSPALRRHLTIERAKYRVSQLAVGGVKKLLGRKAGA